MLHFLIVERFWSSFFWQVDYNILYIWNSDHKTRQKVTSNNGNEFYTKNCHNYHSKKGKKQQDLFIVSLFLSFILSVCAWNVNLIVHMNFVILIVDMNFILLVQLKYAIFQAQRRRFTARRLLLLARRYHHSGSTSFPINTHFAKLINPRGHDFPPYEIILEHESSYSASNFLQINPRSHPIFRRLRAINFRIVILVFTICIGLEAP